MLKESPELTQKTDVLAARKKTADDTLGHALSEWSAFLEDTQRRIDESAQSGLPPAPAQEQPIRKALAALSPAEITAFVSQESLVEHHLEPGQEPVLGTFMRFAFLLGVLPPKAAPALTRLFDDPCHARTNLPERAPFSLFLTLRWRTFLLAFLKREHGLLTLHHYRQLIHGFLERAGDHTPAQSITANDPGPLARELAEAVRKHEGP